MKVWIKKALELLNKSLNPIPQELNELYWKESLSPKNDKLSRHISAFANMAGGGFMVFGIEDKSAKPKGVKPEAVKLIIDKLSNICRDSLEPKIGLDHSVERYLGQSILIVFIKESGIKPVQIAGKSIEDVYIRSSGTTRKASRQELGILLLNSKNFVFEDLHASTLKNQVEVITQIDYASIFTLLKNPIPSDFAEIIRWLTEEKMIHQIESDGFYITNFGALAAAQDLKQFDDLARKAVRLIKYEGKNKANQSKEYPLPKGYAIGFEGLIQFIKSLLPGSEVFKSALRTETSLYPEIAIRELIANALIHQDFSIRGSGPMIEVFSDRIEITNPGKLLPNKNIDRLIRTTPESRNEILAAAFRRYRIFEEAGSGFEKIITAIELYGLPPLKLQEYENAFKATLFAPKTFAQMTESERIEACYQHSIIQYFGNDGMTNATLRLRFKMSDKQAPQISKLFNAALRIGRIKIKNPESDSRKFISYLPYWA